MNDFAINNNLMPKFQDIVTPKINNSLSGTLQGQISKDVNLSQDQELMNDLQTLLNQVEPGTSVNFEQDGAPVEKIADSFAGTLNNYLQDTNKKSEDAEKAIQTFASGGDIDVHSVMIAQEKANLSMQLTLQLRNKMLEAYKEISQIHV